MSDSHDDVEVCLEKAQDHAPDTSSRMCKPNRERAKAAQDQKRTKFKEE